MVLRGHEEWVRSVAVSVDGKRVVSGSIDKSVRVWDERDEGWTCVRIFERVDNFTLEVTATTGLYDIIESLERRRHLCELLAGVRYDRVASTKFGFLVTLRKCPYLAFAEVVRN